MVALYSLPYPIMKSVYGYVTEMVKIFSDLKQWARYIKLGKILLFFLITEQS